MTTVPHQLPSGTTFYFARHGATAANTNNVRCGGDLDVPLLPIGAAQAQAVAAIIRAHALPIELLITSALLRARQTAEIISMTLGGLPIVLEPLLDERRLGTLNGASVFLTESVITAEQAPPSVEPVDTFQARVSHALHRHRDAVTQGTLLVSSKGVARMISRVLDIAEHVPVSNGGLLEYRIGADRQTCRHLL